MLLSIKFCIIMSKILSCREYFTHPSSVVFHNLSSVLKPNSLNIEIELSMENSSLLIFQMKILEHLFEFQF